MTATIEPVHDIIRIADHLLGAPAVGLGALITAIATLYTSLKANKKILSVKQDMENNHGSSLRDAVDRIESNTQTLTDLVHAHTRQLDDIQSAVRRHDEELKSRHASTAETREPDDAPPCAHTEGVQHDSGDA